MVTPKSTSAEKTAKRQFRLDMCAMLMGYKNWNALETAVVAVERKREKEDKNIEFMKDELGKIARHMIESLEG